MYDMSGGSNIQPAVVLVDEVVPAACVVILLQKSKAVTSGVVAVDWRIFNGR